MKSCWYFLIRNTVVGEFRKNAYQQINLKLVFWTTFRIVDLFKIKDPTTKKLKSKLVYGIHRTDCDFVYVGKTKLNVIFRLGLENIETWTRPSYLTSTVHDVLFDEVQILTYGKTDTEFLIKESLIINQLNPRLNVTVKSFPLDMF